MSRHTDTWGLKVEKVETDEEDGKTTVTLVSANGKTFAVGDDAAVADKEKFVGVAFDRLDVANGLVSGASGAQQLAKNSDKKVYSFNVTVTKTHEGENDIDKENQVPVEGCAMDTKTCTINKEFKGAAAKDEYTIVAKGVNMYGEEITGAVGEISMESDDCKAKYVGGDDSDVFSTMLQADSSSGNKVKIKDEASFTDGKALNVTVKLKLGDSSYVDVKFTLDPTSPAA